MQDSYANATKLLKTLFEEFIESSSLMLLAVFDQT